MGFLIENQIYTCMQKKKKSGKKEKGGKKKEKSWSRRELNWERCATKATAWWRHRELQLATGNQYWKPRKHGTTSVTKWRIARSCIFLGCCCMKCRPIQDEVWGKSCFLYLLKIEFSPSTSEYFEADPGQSELIRVIRPRTGSPVQLLSLPTDNCHRSFVSNSKLQSWNFLRKWLRWIPHQNLMATVKCSLFAVTALSALPLSDSF